MQDPILFNRGTIKGCIMIEYEKIEDDEYFIEYTFQNDIIVLYCTRDIHDNWTVQVDIVKDNFVFKHLGDFNEGMIFREVEKQILGSKKYRKTIIYKIFA